MIADAKENKLDQISSNKTESVFLSLFSENLMLRENEGKIVWEEHLKLSYDDADISRINVEDPETWNRFRLGYFQYREQAWLLLQEIFSLSAHENSPLAAVAEKLVNKL